MTIARKKRIVPAAHSKPATLVPVTPHNPGANMSPEDNLRLIAKLRRDVSGLEDMIKTVQTKLMEDMEAREITTLTITGDRGERITGTVVHSESVRLDDEALKKTVGGPVWRKIATMTLDKSKLDAAIKAGIVSLTAVASASTTTKRSPYIRVTAK